ncbi:MAG TPA: arginine--tRNA ligase [Solirubrobacteraceae bacterium]|nr:arginine--tRNA ligase [Solirubrobacteraceae bacterium]
MNKPLTSDQQAVDGPLAAGATPALEALRRVLLQAARQLAAGASQSGGAPAPDGVLLGGGGRGAITLERPPRADFGDYSTNAALLLAPRLGAPPREVAERLGVELSRSLGEQLERFEVAGPGFLNLFLADDWLQRSLDAVLAAGESYGAGSPERAQRVLIEFVSANPTGPMHVGHARNAAYGDALARMLEFGGEDVAREFYVNDAGTQVRTFGASVQALARGEAPPQDGYQGDYVGELAKRLPDAAGSDPAALGEAAVAAMIEGIRTSLAAFGVREFDRWSYESALHEGEPSALDRALARLQELGHTYEKDGALWLRTTEFGDDKDRVLVRSSGEHTYFASDIAYHQDKRERGYERQLDVWGADHHGYVLRMKAAYAALGGDPDELELLIMQLVHLVRSGERAQMSKRAGEFVTLDDLVAEIGVDAARWYLLARSHDTTVDLDLDLARSQSNENPVYYVQYAHARISSVLAKLGEERVSAAVVRRREQESHGELHASERALVKQLLELPSELEAAAARRAPHRVAAYALELAQGFTAFYRDCRVIGAETEAIEDRRIALCLASKRTIARCLALLGVSAPEEM